MSNPIEELVAYHRDRLLRMVSHRGDGIPTQYVNPDGPEAADALTTLQEALRPFAKLADDPINHDLSDDFLVYIRLGDCRKARSALGGEG